MRKQVYPYLQPRTGGGSPGRGSRHGGPSEWELELLTRWKLLLHLSKKEGKIPRLVPPFLVSPQCLPIPKPSWRPADWEARTQPAGNSSPGYSHKKWLKGV